MTTHTTAAHHTLRQREDHDALRELIAENLTADIDPATATGEPRRPGVPMDLLRRCTATRYPTRVQPGPSICRTCHLARTPQERQCDDLLGGQCRDCHDPSL